MKMTLKNVSFDQKLIKNSFRVRKLCFEIDSFWFCMKMITFKRGLRQSFLLKLSFLARNKPFFISRFDEKFWFLKKKAKFSSQIVIFELKRLFFGLKCLFLNWISLFTVNTEIQYNLIYLKKQYIGGTELVYDKNYVI